MRASWFAGKCHITWSCVRWRKGHGSDSSEQTVRCELHGLPKNATLPSVFDGAKDMTGMAASRQRDERFMVCRKMPHYWLDEPRSIAKGHGSDSSEQTVRCELHELPKNA